MSLFTVLLLQGPRDTLSYGVTILMQHRLVDHPAAWFVITLISLHTTHTG